LTISRKKAPTKKAYGFACIVLLPPAVKDSGAFWRKNMPRALLIVIVVILLLGALPAWPYSTGWGYYPSGGLGVILLILLILVLAKKL
jgi:hypothetical protein